MSVNDWIQVIQGVGFPIFVAVYLLIIFNTTLKEHTLAVKGLIAFLKGQNSNHHGG